MGRLEVPEGGLRAVVLEVAVARETIVNVVVEVEGQSFESRTRRGASNEWLFMASALLGEDLTPGDIATVSLLAEGEPGSMMVAADLDGALVVGAIAGDDEYRLVRTSDVLITERVNASFVRVFDSAIVEPDPVAAATHVASRTELRTPAVVSRPVELPAMSDDTAELRYSDLTIGTDRLSVVSDTDRPALVNFAVNNYPGWSATVDGQPAEIVTTDVSFIGVAVPAGRHEVVLDFEPNRLRSLLLIFSLTALASLVVLGRAAWRGDLRFAPRTAR